MKFRPYLYLLLLVPAALAGAVMLILKPPPYEPTGDELYDRFALHVLRQFKTRGYNCSISGDEKGLLSNPGWDENSLDLLISRFASNHQVRQNAPQKMDFGALETWKDDFDKDPRYWQLRVACGLDKAYQAPPEGHLPGAEYDPGPYVKRLQQGVFDRGSCSVLPFTTLYMEDDGLCLELYERAAALDADNSYWHFRLALLYQALGEDVLALKELKSCNSAPKNTWVWEYPYSTLFEARYQRSTALGNRLVRGLIAGELINFGGGTSINYIRIKEAYKEAQAMLALGGDPAYADELIKAAGRMGQMRANMPIGVIVASVCAKLPSEFFRTELLSGPAAKDPALLELRDFGGEVRKWSRGAPGLLSAKGSRVTPFAKAYTLLIFPGSRTQTSSTTVPSGGKTLSSGGASTNASKQTLPPLQIQDWLNFDLQMLSAIEHQQQAADLFVVTQNPPLARICNAVENGTYTPPIASKADSKSADGTAGAEVELRMERLE
ncbi:hypothetical protein IT575_14095 [bacterium]|nr:hypothetical protein [bacterium]